MVGAGYKMEVAPGGATDAQRAVATTGTVVLPMPAAAGFSVRYAYISQRGYYPDAPDKTNQDAVCAAERLGGNPGTHMFAVFDGHGEQGTECAQFVRDKLPVNVTSQSVYTADPAAALSTALILANTQLHDAPIDDCLSGTTACAALLVGRVLHVANVGDSRTVLAEAAEAADSGDGATAVRLVARDLSHDQTPFRHDECLRVIKAGARVMTLDQLEGLKDPNQPCWTNEADCDGDPPRLWSPNGLYPGTAFTRSIGDSAAEDIGVIPDPEMTATQLGPQHRFVILASDGVWEFISSQRAVDMVNKHDNPYDAAKALVAQAYKLWLQKETRTDDISAVVLFFDWGAAAAQCAPAPAVGGLQSHATPPQVGEAQPRPSLWRAKSGKSAGAAAAAAVAAVSLNAASS